MIDAFIEHMKDMNISQIFVIFAGMWFLYNRLDKKITDLKGDIKSLEVELKGDIKELGVKIEDIDRRLCRIEGSLSTHGHCLFNQSKNDQKIV